MPRSAIATGARRSRAAGGADPGSPRSTTAGRSCLNGAREACAPLARTPRTGWPRSSIFCAPRPRTISRSTSQARCSAGSSGAWRWPASTDSGRYLELLRQDPGELELLAKDLLINVTSFFRDPEAFDFLAKEIVPDLVRRHQLGPAAADLGCRLQHRRGDLFDRHAFPRGNRRGEAEHQAAGLRLRCR